MNATCAYNYAATFGSGVTVNAGMSNTIRGVIMNNQNADQGAGVMLYNATNTVVNAVIRDNAAANHGGGIGILGGSNNVMQGCVFSNNVSSATNATIYLTNVTVTNNPFAVSNCVFYGNGGTTHYAIYEHVKDITNQTIISNAFWTNTMSYLYGDPTGAITTAQWGNINTANTTNDALYRSNNIVMPQSFIAKNINSGLQFGSFQSAVDAANAGDEIRVLATNLTRTLGLNSLAVTNGVFITNKNNLRVIGGYDAAFTTQTGYTALDGLNASAISNRIVFIENLTNLTFDGFVIRGGGKNIGTPMLDGAGVYAMSVGQAVFTNIIVSNNYAVFGGGGVFNNCTNTVVDGIFSGNVASNSGGGVCVIAGDNVRLSGSLSNNFASNSGGGIITWISINCSVNSLAVNNTAAIGGGINIYGCSNTIVNASVSNNRAYDAGGGVCDIVGRNNILSGVVSSNYAVNAGGGIYLISSTNVTVNASVGNSAGTLGGGVAVIQGISNTITSSINNNSGYLGGGVALLQTKDVWVNGSFSSNYASSGGGLYLFYATNTYVAASMVSNTSTVGSAVFIDTSSNSVFSDCFFTNNAAAWTNAVIHMSNVTAKAGAMIVSNCTFYGGGANPFALFEQLDPDVSNHTIIGNKFWTNTLKYLYIESGKQIISNDRIDILNSNSTWHDAAIASRNAVRPIIVIATNTNTGGIYDSLQSAVDEANAGDEIRVLATNLTRAFGLNALAVTNGLFITNKNNLHICGGYDAAFTSIAGNTVLDCGGAARNNRAVYVGDLSGLAFSNFVLSGGGSNAILPTQNGTGLNISNAHHCIVS
ncbi:MAG: hypothetical protein AABZ39_03680, partial [Spirochaetota bacterium]